MVRGEKINVEVVYATPSQQKLIALQVEEGTIIEEAILMSGILQLYPEVDLSVVRVGVFSQFRTLEDEVYEGDRIEIYRNLIIDPKEARRTKAKSLARGLKTGGKTK